MIKKGQQPTVVLVHAAWFDGSSWNRVISGLEQRGYRAVAAQLPLTSLTDDIECVRRWLRRENDPLIMVGHSYGGGGGDRGCRRR